MWFSRDIHFRVIMRHLFFQMEQGWLLPSVNSIEFIKTGHVLLITQERTLDLRGPVIFWIRAGEKFKFKVEPDSILPCEHLYIDFTGPESDRILTGLDHICPDGSLIPNDVEKATEYFHRMIEYFHLDGKYYLPELIVDLDRLLLLITRSVSKPRTIIHQDLYGIQAAADGIRRNPFKDYDFRLMAQDAGCSYAHYRRLFQRNYKISPHAFLIRERMYRAEEMLTTTDLLIKEVMYSCGYNSMMEFSRTFKRYFKLSPSRFRQAYREQQTAAAQTEK